jgi:hypothetical protein
MTDFLTFIAATADALAAKIYDPVAWLGLSVALLGTLLLGRAIGPYGGWKDALGFGLVMGATLALGAVLGPSITGPDAAALALFCCFGWEAGRLARLLLGGRSAPQ